MDFINELNAFFHRQEDCSRTDNRQLLSLPTDCQVNGLRGMCREPLRQLRRL